MLTPPQAAFHDTPVGLERIRGAGTLLLAVSGGPDSMGMLQALAALRGAEGAPLIEVATVDHGLRPESADEAAMVSRECASFGLTHHILRIAAPPHRGVQANARFLRYRLLAACARERSLDTIVTAHHEGDQAETIAMRLAHRSGPEGLAGIRRHSIFDGVPVLRPFLDWPAAGLRALSAMGPCVDDPSNRDLRYERVRVREVLGAVAAERLLRLGGRAERLRSRREAARHAAIAAHWRLLPSGHASIPLATLAGMSEPLRAGVMGALVPAIAGGRHRPALAARKIFLERILSGQGATLAGCRAVVRGGVVWLGREWGRAGLAPVALVPGRAIVWDERFVCRAPESLPAGYAIAPLGEDKDLLPADIPSVLRRTAPAIRDPRGELALETRVRAEWLGGSRLALLVGRVPAAAGQSAFTQFEDCRGTMPFQPSTACLCYTSN